MKSTETSILIAADTEGSSLRTHSRKNLKYIFYFSWPRHEIERESEMFLKHENIKLR
jgi:hypothetical protein